MSFSRPLMWLLSSRGKSFDAVFTFLLWMLRYRSRGNTTLAPPGSASADRRKRKSKLMSIWGGDVVVIEIGSFLSGFTNPMSFFEVCRLRLYSRKIFWKTVSFFGPPCCCKGVEGENEERPLAGRRAAAKKRCKDFFRKNVVLEAWRLRYMTEKEISRWYWLRIGASWRTNQINGSVSEPWKEKTRTSTVWHQFWRH